MRSSSASWLAVPSKPITCLRNGLSLAQATSSSISRVSQSASAISALSTILRELAGAQHRHRVDHDRACLGRRQPAGDHRRIVGRADQHAIAGLHAVVLDQRMRQAVGPVGQLLVGAPPAVADQRGVVAEALFDQSVGQLDRGVEVLGIVEAVEQEVRPLVDRRKIVAGKRVDMCGRAELHNGTTAVASISTFARGSTNATTCTSVIAGKCLPMISR